MRRLFLWLFLVAFLPFSVNAVAPASLKIPMVAVMPFTGRTLDSDALETIAATLATDLLNTGKFRVMERSQMESILKEQGFQQSGACDGSECAVEVGKLLSVDHMVVGTVGKVGGTYVMNARLVSVQTGEVLKSVTKTSKAEEDAIVTDLLPQLAQDLSGRAGGSVPMPSAPVVAMPPTLDANHFAESSRLAQDLSGHAGAPASMPSAPVVAIPPILEANHFMDARDDQDFTDVRDDQVYKFVTIGNQTWMAQNLNYAGAGAGACYDNLPSNCIKYGRLYTWNEVMAGAPSSTSVPSGVQGICPSDWHVPSDAEWSILIHSVDSATSGTKFKSTSGWYNSGNGTNAYGFNILPAGGRDNNWSFEGLGNNASFWSSSEGGAFEAWRQYFSYIYAYVLRLDYGKSLGFSLRCLRD